MRYIIKELRELTGMTQKAFADSYGIPISTLRKWEQGESSPPAYVIKLIAKTLPGTDTSLVQLKGDDGSVYYYDKRQRTVADAKGNISIIQEELEEIKKQNLSIYLQELFESFYEIQDKFNRDYRYDKEEDILWSRQGRCLWQKMQKNTI